MAAAVAIESDVLRVAVLPEFGARVVSFVDKRSGREWIFQGGETSDTGEDAMTGGRLKRVAPYLGDETFCFTYGDGVGDVDITASIAFHRAQKKLATVTAAQPPGRRAACAG